MEKKTNQPPIKGPATPLDPLMQSLSDKVNAQAQKIVITGSAHPTQDLMNAMEKGAKEFESAKGRPMTYAEMRNMWG